MAILRSYMNKENNQSNSTLKVILKKYWWIVAICLIAPIAINYVLLIPAFAPVVGTNIDWLSFFGSYIAAIIPALGAFIILFIQREDNHKENEQNRQLQINVLKYQQEMQWLNENRNIILAFVLTLSKNDLIELSVKLSLRQDILPDVKRLLSQLVKHDSRVGFMRVSEKTPSYNEFNTKRGAAYSIYRDFILDLQEINLVFSYIDPLMRMSVLKNHQQQNLIHKGLNDVIATYPSEQSFIQSNAFEVATKLIDALPDLLEDTRKAALAYIKSEEERIADQITVL